MSSQSNDNNELNEIRRVAPPSESASLGVENTNTLNLNGFS